MAGLNVNALRGAPADARADALLGLLEADGQADYIGEAVSQLAHALQAAALAAAKTQDEEILLAALLHDVGHLAVPGAPSMAGLGALRHEAIGSGVLLALGASPRLASLVGGHVDAKRYLARAPGYLAGVSEASKGTLAFQGGPMGGDEAAAFEADPDFDARILVRRCDEGAKIPGAEVPGLLHWRPALVRRLGAGLSP